MSRLNYAGWLCLAAGVLVQAQPLQFRAPLSGRVYDPPSRSIRPLLGVPGAAWLGEPISTGVDYASVAPNGRYALTLRSGQAALAVFDSDGAATETPIAGAVADADRAVWAFDSSMVLLASSAGRLVQRIANLPDSPSAGEPIATGGDQAALAIYGPSGTIAAAVRAGADSGLYLLSETAPPVRLLTMDEPAAVVFSRDGQVLYAAERSTGAVFAVRNLSSGGEIVPLVAAQDALTQPVGLAADEGYLYIAGAADRLIRVYDAAGGSLIKEIPLEAVPAGLEPVSARGVFVIAARGASSQPLLLLDARAQSVSYVPAAEEK